MSAFFGLFRLALVDLEAHQLAFSPRDGLSVFSASVTKHAGKLSCFLRCFIPISCMEPYLKLVKFGTMMQFSKIFRPVTYPAEYFHRSSTTSFILNILLISLPEGEAEEKQLVYIRILNTNENCLLPLPRSSFMAFLVSFVLK